MKATLEFDFEKNEEDKTEFDYAVNAHKMFWALRNFRDFLIDVENGKAKDDLGFPFKLKQKEADKLYNIFIDMLKDEGISEFIDREE